MANIKVISRPEPDADTPDDAKPSGIKIISRPKPPQVSGFYDHYRQDVDESVRQMKEPGVFNKAMGALGYVTSPLQAASQAIGGDPAQYIAQKLGAGQTGQAIARGFGEAGVDVLGPGAVAKGVREAPGALREAMPLINKAATFTGQQARGLMDAAEDIIKNRVAGRARKAAEAEANKAPTLEALTKDKNTAYKEAYEAGAKVTPERFADFVDKDLKAVQDAGRIKLKDTLTPQAKALKDNLESYRGKELTLEDLDDLLKENRDFVARAATEAKNSNVRSDLAAAQTLAKATRDFVMKWEPETAGAKGAEALGRAKELASRTIKMRQVQEIIDVAKNLDSADEIQSAMRSIVKDPQGEFKNFTPAEQKLISEIAADSRVAETAKRAPLVNKAAKAVSAARGVNSGDKLKKAQELLDLIARGKTAQEAPKDPSAFSQIMGTLSPERGLIRGQPYGPTRPTPAGSPPPTPSRPTPSAPAGPTGGAGPQAARPLVGGEPGGAQAMADRMLERLRNPNPSGTTTLSPEAEAMRLRLLQGARTEEDARRAAAFEERMRRIMSGEE